MGAIVEAYAKTLTPPITNEDKIKIIITNLASVTESARKNPEELEIFSNLLQCGEVVIDAMLEKMTEPNSNSVIILRNGVSKTLFEGKDLSEIIDVLGKYKGYILPKEVYTKLESLLEKYKYFDSASRDTLIRISLGLATKEEIDALINKYPEAKDDIIALKNTRTTALKGIDPSTLDETDQNILDQEAENDQDITNYFQGKPGLEGLADAFGRAAQAARDLSNAIGQILKNNPAAPYGRITPENATGSVSENRGNTIYRGGQDFGYVHRLAA
jgi:hypothetical protein